MDFSRKEESVIEATIIAADKELLQLNDLQLLAVGGGVADVTFS